MTVNLSQIAKRTDAFFMEKSPIHDAMRRLTKTLGEMNIAFAIAGAMAANAHGHRRTTAYIDILIREEDLQAFKERWIGRGWVDKFEGSKNFRDTIVNVDIDALIVGKFPGDGLPKPVAFPNPELVVDVSEEGLPYVSLPSLLELKIACGMTTIHRPRDLDDVIQLIKVNKLPQAYGETLNPFVQQKFGELWQAAQISDDY